MREAAAMFDRTDLEQLQSAGEGLESIGKGLKWFAGKTVASLVAGVKFMPDFLAGNYRDTWGSESVVSQDLRNRKETAARQKKMEEEKKADELRLEHQKLINEELLQEQVYFQKASEAEENRIDALKARLALEKESARTSLEALSASRSAAIRDRSGWSVAELAAMDSSSPFFSKGAVPSIMKARTVQFLENRARYERASGNTGFADTLSKEALFARKELGALTGSEQNPLQALDDMRNALNTMLEMSMKDGLPVQPRMAK
jgi:hypothetical protein